MALETNNSFNADISGLAYPESHRGPHSNLDNNTLPNGFPTALTTNFVWNGARLTDEEHYTYNLIDDQISEIEAAVAFFRELELDGDLVTQGTFPLPRLQYVLRDLCNEVHNGKGFFVIRGLNPNKYSVEDNTIIFLGIQAYIAEQRARQDDSGNMIVHIISDSSTTSSPTRDLHSRHSKKSITFHTEETGDIIAWQTRNTAARGGSCIISSTHTIYNILANTRPDIIHTLAQPDWPFALPTPHNRPILFHDANSDSSSSDSHLLLNFNRASLLGSAAHPRPAHLPTLTAAQSEALDVLEAVARGVELRIHTRAGDVHFVNNLTVLHRRDEFVDDDDDDAAAAAAAAAAADADVDVDGEEGGVTTDEELGMCGENNAAGKKKMMKKKRHLVRMRLRNADVGWQLPAALAGEWEKVFAREGVEPVWHLEPMPEGFFPLRKYPL